MIGAVLRGVLRLLLLLLVLLVVVRLLVLRLVVAGLLILLVVTRLLVLLVVAGLLHAATRGAVGRTGLLVLLIVPLVLVHGLGLTRGQASTVRNLISLGCLRYRHAHGHLLLLRFLHLLLLSDCLLLFGLSANSICLLIAHFFLSASGDLELLLHGALLGLFPLVVVVNVKSLLFLKFLVNNRRLSVTTSSAAGLEAHSETRHKDLEAKDNDASEYEAP